MASEKIPPSRRPLGEAAKMLQLVSLARHGIVVLWMQRLLG
jgi:hypothetical protein